MSLFDKTYDAHWESRWPPLKEALLQPNKHVALYPSGSYPKELRALDESKYCTFIDQPVKPSQTNNGLLDFYPIDRASLYPVLALSPTIDDKVADICAAPGGKTLFLTTLVKAENLWVNELSSSRFTRLKKVLRSYLPQEDFLKLHLSNSDASRWNLHKRDFFDKILLDAPCSSERHLLHKPEELSKWSPARTKNLSIRQYTLLCAALLSLKPRGTLIYATCSISPIENDDVISRLLKKKGKLVKVNPLSFNLGQATQWGWQILPDRHEGWGPLYFSSITRLSDNHIQEAESKP